MTSGPPLPNERVPTLTEVVAWPEGVSPQMQGGPSELEATVVPASGDVQNHEPAGSKLPSEPELTQRVLTDVQRQIDLMLEYRLREVLSPLLARATDNLIREARNELASTLREVVARAVAQELARKRGR